MAEIVAVGLDGSEGDAAQTVDLADELAGRGFLGFGVGEGRGEDEVDVGFFAGANTGACGGEGVPREVGVEGKVVKAAVGEAVAVVWSGSVNLLVCVGWIFSVLSFFHFFGEGWSRFRESRKGENYILHAVPGR